MLRAGFGDQDFTKPIVGIANGYSTITPATWAKRTGSTGGGWNSQRRCHAPDVRHNHYQRRISGNRGDGSIPVSREVIADLIETAQWAEYGWGAGDCGCDKNMPGR